MPEINRLEMQEIDMNNLLESVNTSINSAENMSSSGDLKESIVLDLSKQLQDKFESITNLEIDLNKKNRTIKKKFLRLYGLISAIDKMTSESVEVPHELQTLIDCLNDFICEAVEEHFFPDSHGKAVPYDWANP